MADNITFGTAVEFSGTDATYIASAYDPVNNKVVIFYANLDDSTKGYAAVGTVSGTGISFGTPVKFNDAGTSSIASIYDVNSGKFVVTYRDTGNSDYGSAKVGTVSGTSISFGTAATFNSHSTIDNCIAYDSTNNKVVIAYRDLDDSNSGNAVVGTVSGTGISFGTIEEFNATYSDEMCITYDSSNNRVVIFYRDTNESRGSAIVGTVSGTGISFGTSVEYGGDNSQQSSAAFDSKNNKVVVAFRNVANSSYGTARVGTVSGTSISFGTAVAYEEATSSTNSVVYDANAEKIVISYVDSGNSSYETARVGEVDGTDISFAEVAVVLNEAESIGSSGVYDSGNKNVIIAYRSLSTTNRGITRVGNLPAAPSTATGAFFQLF